MRMMLKAQLETEAADRAIKDGTLAKTIMGTMDYIKPEAAFFTADGGMRTCYAFFDMKDTTQIPRIAEPLFLKLNASVQFSPVMNAEEMQKGLEAWAKSGA